MGNFAPKKSKLFHFVWKLAHMLSQGCWFLFQHYFSEFPTLNFFLGKFGPKKSKLSVLSKTWHTCYLEDEDFYFNISFLNFQSKIHFWVNLGRKSQICLSCLKMGSHGIFIYYFFELQNLNSFLGKFSPKESNYPFYLKIGIQSIRKMLILIPTLVFSNF